MKTTVVYGSRYGTAEKYARRLAQLLECEVVSASAFAGARSGERVIFVGSLYAQRVTALKKTIKRIAPGASVCVVTVGLADPAIPKNVERITSSVKNQLPDSFRSAKVYCLRGGIDFSKLGFIHKAMMTGIYQVMKSKTSLSEEDRMFVDAYGKKIDYFDLETVTPIAKELSLAKV